MAHAPTHYAGLVQSTIEQILRQPSVALGLDACATAVDLEPAHFAWLFWGMVGEPLEGFIRRICLERAVVQLVTTNRPLAEIARDVGYSAPDRFEADFKAAFTTSARLSRRLRVKRFHLSTTCGVHYSDRDDPPLFLPVDSLGRFLPVATRHQPPLRLATSAPASTRAELDLRLSELWSSLPAAPTDPAAADAGSESGAGRRNYVIPLVTADGESAWLAAIEVPVDAPLPAHCGDLAVPGGRIATTALDPGSDGRGVDDVPVAWRRFIGEWLPSTSERLRRAPLIEAWPADSTTPDGAPPRPRLWLPLV